MRVATITLIAGLCMMGCVEDSGPALYIEGNIRPDDECAFEPGGELLDRGAFNPDIAVDYVFYPRYANQLFPNSSDAPPRPDPNGILIEGAEITIMDAAGGTLSFGGLPNPFTVSNTVFVPSSSGAGGDPGVAAGTITLIPAVYTDELRATTTGTFQVLVSIKAFGETLGHVSVDAREFIWPIDVCRGDCLVDLGSTAVADTATCCSVGQDRTVSVNCVPSLLP